MTRADAIAILRRVLSTQIDGRPVHRLTDAEEEALRSVLDSYGGYRTLADLELEERLVAVVTERRRELGLTARGVELRIEGLAKTAADLGMPVSSLLRMLAQAEVRHEADGAAGRAS